MIRLYFEIVKHCLIVIAALFVVSCGSNITSQTTNTTPDNANPYLVQPTGPYQVGFKDYHYININFCPDVFYTGSNQNYFSSGNTQYCHEIMIRVYYPSNYNLPTPYSLYYYPAILDTESLIMMLDPNISLGEAQQLESLTSYTRLDLPLSLGHFPVILFSPGLGIQGQLYEDIIAQLASYGYIVVAVNSVFISGSVQLPDGVIVPFVPAASESSIWQIYYPEALSDLEFMYQQVVNNNRTDPIFAAMDLQHIGALGHSLGGLEIVDVAHNNPGWFQAVSPMDEGITFGAESDIIAKHIAPVTDPILYQFASLSYIMIESVLNITPPLVTSQAYRVIITPSLNDVTYSSHINFADISTLQYEPVINEAFTYSAEIGSPVIGSGNGFDITNSINGYLLPFFNYYLKNLGSNPFTGCKPLTDGSILTCGPTT